MSGDDLAEFRKGRIATDDMVRAANPPEGFEPIVSNSPFSWANGPLFQKRDGNRVLRGFRVAERHINMGGACHGGMVMTFADILLATAAYQVQEGPKVTVRLTTDFIGPALLGDWVEGRAEGHDAGDGFVAVSGKIYVGERAVATASGFFKAIRRTARERANADA